MRLETKKKAIINIVFYALIIILAVLIFKYALLWLTPFVIGVIVAIVLQRPVDWLTKKTKLPRTVWSITLVIAVFVALSAIVCFLFFRIYVEASGFVTEKLPQYMPVLTEAVNNVYSYFQDILKDMPTSFSDTLESMSSSISATITDTLTSLVKSVGTYAATHLPGFLINFVVSIIACCFITKDYYRITGFLERQFSPEKWEIIVETKGHFTKNIIKMLKGYGIIMFITFSELFVGFLIMRVDYALIIALLVAIVDIFPVLGTGTVLIPWAVIDLITGNYSRAIGILVLYAVITIIRNIIEPKIIGDQVGLPPLLTLIAMFLGLQTFGLVGLFAFPIVLIVLKNLNDTGKIKIWK